MRNAKPAVGVVRAIAEAVDAERAGILAGAHAHPRGHGDGRDHAFETSPHTLIHQAADIFQARIVEDDAGCGAVESQDADFHVRPRGKNSAPCEPTISRPIASWRAFGFIMSLKLARSPADIWNNYGRVFRGLQGNGIAGAMRE